MNRAALAYALAFSAVFGAFWGFRILAAPPESLGDVNDYYYPLYRATYADGIASSWNPYALAGVPRFASPGAATLYPPHLLYTVFPTALGMGISNLLHLLLAGVGMSLFARSLGLGWSAVLLGAAFVTMRGRLPDAGIHPNMLECGAWLFMGAAAVSALARERVSLGIVGLAVCTGASVLAGYPQYTTYSVYAWGGLLVVLLLEHRRGPAELGMRIGGFALAVALGAGLSAIQLLPAFELSVGASRSLGGLSATAMFPYGPPGFTVSDAVTRLLSPHEGSLVLGTGWLGLALLPLGLLLPGRRVLTAGVLGFGLLVLGFAAGPASPLHEPIKTLPLLDSFRLPGRSILVVEFCIAIAVAIGFDGLRRWIEARTSSRIATALSITIGIAVLAELMAIDPTWRSRPAFSPQGYARVYDVEHAFYARVRAEPERLLSWNPGPAPVLPLKLGSVFGLRTVDDYEPMSPARQSAYFHYLATGALPTREARFAYYGRIPFHPDPAVMAEMASRQRLLDLAAVRFVLVPRQLANGPSFRTYADATGVVQVAGPRRGLVLFENPRSLPRAYVTHRALPAPPPEALLPALSRADFDPLSASYLEGDVTGLDAAGERPGHAAAIVVDEANRVEIEATLEAPGLLVLADAFDPGWSATVDGEALEIRPANHLFRGVLLPAGTHRVRFDYQSRSLQLGAWVSFSTAVLLAGLGWRAVAERRTREPRRE